MLGISKNMTRLRQLYEMRKSLLDNTSFISEDQKQEFIDLIKEIDSVEQKDYSVLLASKTYSTTNNYDELKRLRELVELIEERHRSRMEMVVDFSRIFRSDITFNEEIKEFDKLDIYSKKIAYLESITNNEHTIDNNKKLINDLSIELSNEYEHSKENNRINKELEDKLLNKITIKTNLSTNKEYGLVSIIDVELNSYKLKLSDLLGDNNLLKEKLSDAKEESSKAKEKYHTALISYNANKEYGGNILESYRVLGEIKREYFTSRYYEILLGICALVIPLKESDYDNLVGKRYRLLKLLDERKSLRNELDIKTYDRLSNLYNEVNVQCRRLLEQGNNIDNIDELEHNIALLTNQIDNLESENNKLLNNIKQLDNDITNDNTKVKKINVRPDNNMVIAIENVPNIMNLEIINFKTKNVLEKVYELFNTKNKVQGKIETVLKQDDVNEELDLSTIDIPIMDIEKPVVEENSFGDLPVIVNDEEVPIINDIRINPEISIESIIEPESFEEPVYITGEEPILIEEEDIFEDTEKSDIKEEPTVILEENNDLYTENEPMDLDLFTIDGDEDNFDVGMIFPNDEKESIDDSLFWPQVDVSELKEPQQELEKTQELSLDEQVERFLKNLD